jgi:pyruvate formate lyase activating enzyme
MTGLVFNIQRFSTHDGPGIRTTVFLKGCPLRCQWCHNPEGQLRGPELALFADRCINCGVCVEICPQHAVLENDPGPTTDRIICQQCGLCTDWCPAGARERIGQEMPVGEVTRAVARDLPFFEESGGGVTFSGGEPLDQPEFLRGCLAECRALGIHTAVETCGMARWDTLQRVAALTDLFLYDLKVMDEDRHRELTDVGNALILANLKALVAQGSSVRVRIPLVPGLTDDAENLDSTARFLNSLARPVTVHVLPYHRMAVAKYTHLRRHCLLGDLPDMPAADAERAADRLARAGLEVIVGG